jgi:hypothetical protein
MRIILVVTDYKRKNILFVTDDLKAHDLKSAVKLTKEEKLDSIHIVKTGYGTYLRSDPNGLFKDNLDAISISANQLSLSLDDLAYMAFRTKKKFKALLHHLDLHASMIKEKGEHVIYIEEHPLITREQVVEKLKPYKKLALSAAKQFSIDPYMLGAIIIDEIARANPWESIFDKLVFVGRNTSAGIAQVKIETARGLIYNDYYNPNPNDKKLSNKNVIKTPKLYLYTYVKKPRHSIFFAAARIREIIDQWLPTIDLSNRTDIIGTLYNQRPRKPNKNPVSSNRGKQIHNEFYTLAKNILN